jgi:hypothetical protein
MQLSGEVLHSLHVAEHDLQTSNYFEIKSLLLDGKD